MHSTTMRSGAAQEHARRFDWSAVATWVLGFGLVVYLGLEGGGYDPLVHDQVGIAVWWILLAGVVVGALPRRPPDRACLCRAGAARRLRRLDGAQLELDRERRADLRRPRSRSGLPRRLRSRRLRRRRTERSPHGRRGRGGDRRGRDRRPALAPAPGLVPGGGRDGAVPLQRPRTSLLPAQLLERPRGG